MAGSGRGNRRVSADQQDEVHRLARVGVHYLEIVARTGVSLATVYVLVGAAKALPPDRRSRLRLSRAEREEIRAGLAAGVSLRAIARSLGRNPSSVCREVNRNGGREAYRAYSADGRALRQARRPRPSKLAWNTSLRRVVVEKLRLYWSPQQISAHLKSAYPDDEGMRISHETIYQSLFVQGRGSLKKELTKCLRSGRMQRRPHGSKPRGLLSDMILIRERPAEVEDRAVPGHWEGDLIVGREGDSAIGTLVERSTRFVMLLHLPHGKTAQHVREALTRRILELPEAIRRSLTWDQGKELAQHTRFTIDTGVQVYFCDPSSPWQRGSNENTNGLLRQYFPKKTDLSVHDQAHLNAVADQLNGRPRQTLGWRTPAEAYAQAVALTT